MRVIVRNEGMRLFRIGRASRARPGAPERFTLPSRVTISPATSSTISAARRFYRPARPVVLLPWFAARLLSCAVALPPVSNALVSICYFPPLLGLFSYLCYGFIIRQPGRDTLMSIFFLSHVRALVIVPYLFTLAE